MSEGTTTDAEATEMLINPFLRSLQGHHILFTIHSLACDVGPTIKCRRWVKRLCPWFVWAPAGHRWWRAEPDELPGALTVELLFYYRLVTPRPHPHPRTHKPQPPPPTVSVGFYNRSSSRPYRTPLALNSAQYDGRELSEGHEW